MAGIFVLHRAAVGDLAHGIIQNRLSGIAAEKRHRILFAQFPLSGQIRLQECQLVGKQIVEHGRPHIGIRRIGKRMADIRLPLQPERQHDGGADTGIRHPVRLFTRLLPIQIERDFLAAKFRTRPGQQIT